MLVDPTKHPELDGSGTVRNVRAGAASRLGPGVRFSADMRRTVPYRVRNKVVEFEEGRKIAWAHAGGHRWRYQLKPEADGTTLVIETFDWSTSPVPWVIERLGFPVHNLPGMEESLARLEALSTATR
ncbi:MAG: dimethyladenosine transferase [Acidimicrobiaceae bacterium]|nr:dimethyladenosine transferase [Acidimicrobiaceae bacterium]